MKKLALTGFVAALAFTLSQSARAADDPKAIVDKGIKALGGEEKLSKVKAYSWKSKGKIKFGDSEGEFTGEGIAQGLDHLRTKVSGEFMGNKFEVVAVLAGDKGWRTNFMTGAIEELDKEARNRLKNLREGTPEWEIEYPRVVAALKRQKGLM